MRLKLASDTLWINTMPMIATGPKSDEPELHDFGITLQLEGVPPEGKYELEVRLKSPDGKEHTATARMVVAHAC